MYSSTHNSWWYFLRLITFCVPRSKGITAIGIFSRGLALWHPFHSWWCYVGHWPPTGGFLAIPPEQISLAHIRSRRLPDSWSLQELGRTMAMFVLLDGLSHGGGSYIIQIVVDGTLQFVQDSRMILPSKSGTFYTFCDTKWSSEVV